jgi:hypothetical protein
MLWENASAALGNMPMAAYQKDILPEEKISWNFSHSTIL